MCSNHTIIRSFELTSIRQLAHLWLLIYHDPYNPTSLVDAPPEEVIGTVGMPLDSKSNTINTEVRIVRESRLLLQIVEYSFI